MTLASQSLSGSLGLQSQTQEQAIRQADLVIEMTHDDRITGTDARSGASETQESRFIRPGVDRASGGLQEESCVSS